MQWKSDNIFDILYLISWILFNFKIFTFLSTYKRRIKFNEHVNLIFQNVVKNGKGYLNAKENSVSLFLYWGEGCASSLENTSHPGKSEKHQ